MNLSGLNWILDGFFPQVKWNDDDNKDSKDDFFKKQSIGQNAVNPAGKKCPKSIYIPRSQLSLKHSLIVH